jgi:hypothetical protein
MAAISADEDIVSIGGIQPIPQEKCVGLWW